MRRYSYTMCVIIVPFTQKGIQVIENEDGTYSYTHPYGDVTVNVVYHVSAAPFANPFIDVPEGSYFYRAYCGE